MNAPTQAHVAYTVAKGVSGFWYAEIDEPRNPSGKYIIGCCCDGQDAMNKAECYLLDRAGVPHWQAQRALKTAELDALGDAELRGRIEILRKRGGHVAHNEIARIHRTMKLRKEVRA